jgi:hypothetical protein
MSAAESLGGLFLADVAQLAEQLICNQQVRGSIPLVSSVVQSRVEMPAESGRGRRECKVAGTQGPVGWPSG